MSLDTAIAQHLANLAEYWQIGRSLNEDELAVLLRLARKLAEGKRKHGPLDLKTDRRQWLEELLQEQLDATHYIAMAIEQMEGQ